MLADRIEQWLGLSPFAKVEKPAVHRPVSGAPPNPQPLPQEEFHR